MCFELLVYHSGSQYSANHRASGREVHDHPFGYQKSSACKFAYDAAKYVGSSEQEDNH